MLLHIHELSRRTGNSMVHAKEYPAPELMGTDVIQVREGSPIELDLRLSSVMEGILVSGSIAATAEGECVRCLAPVQEALRVEASELFLYPESVARAADDGDEDLSEMFVTDGETLDLEPLVRDLLVTALPFQPVCGPDCLGLCPQCGVRLEDAEPDHHHDVIDPRFAALKNFFEQSGSEETL